MGMMPAQDDKEFDRIIQAQWDRDEYYRLELNERVHIDLAYLSDYAKDSGHYPMDYLVEHGHGMEGVIQERWKDVDGFYMYTVKCTDGCVRGAYARRDLVSLDTGKTER